MKFNVDGLGEFHQDSTSISYMMRDSHAEIMARKKSTDDFPILLVEWLAVWEANILAIQKDIKALSLKVIFNWLSILKMERFVYLNKSSIF